MLRRSGECFRSGGVAGVTVAETNVDTSGRSGRRIPAGGLANLVMLTTDNELTVNRV